MESRSISQEYFIKVMNKFLYFCLTFFLIFVLVSAVSADYTIDASDHDSLNEALESIPMDPGIVTLKISKHNLKDTDVEIYLPNDRNIKEFILTVSDNDPVVSLPEIARICANGVPLTIGEGLVLENASIYGGACVSGEKVQLESSSLTISATVGFVFGGGFAEGGGSSEVKETSITLTKTGTAYYEIFGGGHAFGKSSRVFSENTDVRIEGTADYVLGGGFAEAGGYSECTQTNVLTAEGSSVPVALFSGGSASGSGSLSTVGNAKAVVNGIANWAFSGDFAFGGGETRLEHATRLEILSTGRSEIAYMGSFSSDPGSDAYVNTSELMSCGETGQIVKDSQSADGGEARTLIKAFFPCKTDN